jgi:hypothetical protein
MFWRLGWYKAVWDFTTKIGFREIKCHFLDRTSLAWIRVHWSVFMTKVTKRVVQYVTDNVLRLCTLKSWRCYSSSQSRILFHTQLHCHWVIPTDFLIREGEHVRNSISTRTRMPVVRIASKLLLWSLWKYQLRFCEGYWAYFFFIS